MEIRIFHTRVRVHPLMLLMIPLACRLGLRREVCATALALTFHESAHMIAAKALGVPVQELRLMPFGGSARIGNPYTLSPWQLGCIAAAGPLSNLFMILIGASFAHWGIVSPDAALLFMRINGLLMLFNLLPALPLDGGRILYAAITGRTGAQRALTIGILAGRVVAGGLLAQAIFLFIRHGVVNLSYIFAAVFLIASGPSERDALSISNARALASALSPVSGPKQVAVTAVDSACPTGKALRAAKNGAVNLYLIYSDGTLSALCDDKTLIDLCISDTAAAPVSRARLRRLPEA